MTFIVNKIFYFFLKKDNYNFCYFFMIFLHFIILCLCVAQKALQLPFFSLFFLIPGAVFGRTGNVSSFVTQNTCDQDQVISLDTLGSISVTVVLSVQFWVCEHNMQSVLKINSNGGFKREHVESYSSTTKNIISSLPQCLK